MGFFVMKFWQCRISAACFFNLPPRRNVWGALPSHTVRPDLKEVFSSVCAAFSYEKGLISSVALNVLRYSGACSGKEIKRDHWAAHFQTSCCSCATCQSTEQLNYASAKFTGMTEGELVWQDRARRGPSSGSSCHDGCDLPGVEDQNPGPSAPRRDQCWVCWRCCNPVSKSPDLYFPVVSHLCKGCSACGDLEAAVTFPQLAVFSPHTTAFHPLECPLLLESLVQSWSVGSALCHAANPRKCSHLVAETAKHSLVRAQQSQSQASIYSLSFVFNAVVLPPAKGWAQWLERWCDTWQILWSWRFGCGSGMAGA